MKTNQNFFVALGSLFILVAATVPLQPQVLRKKNQPVTAQPSATPQRAAETRRPDAPVVETPPAPAAPETKTWEKPRYMDDRLDWCLNWGYNCGRPAALAFCHRRRFENVTAFEPEVVGRSAQTRLLGSDQVCNNADFCTGFAFITCSGPIPHERVKANPEWEGYRLDVCLVPGGYCGGKQAADRYCGKIGFSDALDVVLDREPTTLPTKSIGTGAICRTGCRGFQQIICNERRW